MRRLKSDRINTWQVLLFLLCSSTASAQVEWTLNDAMIKDKPLSGVLIKFRPPVDFSAREWRPFKTLHLDKSWA